MRIAGYISHPGLKITIFQLENKYILKFESGLFELAFKFRAGGPVNSVDDIYRLADEAFIEAAIGQMKAMRRIHTAALQSLETGDEKEEFEEII